MGLTNTAAMEELTNATALLTTSITALQPNASILPQHGTKPGSSDISQLTRMQIILYILMAIVGTFGNTLTITVLLKPPFRNRKSSILLLNLAICDALIAALCIPLDVVYFVNKKWVFGKALCYVIPPFQTSLPIVSSWTFMFMMLERNSLFRKQIRGQRRSRSIRILALATWVIAVALVIPYGVRLQTTQDKGVMYCQETRDSPLGRKIYTVVLSVIEFLVPMLIITVLVIRIGINLSRQSKQLLKNSLGLNKARQASRLQQNRSITVMFIVMIAVYASLKLPNNIFWQWSEFGGETDEDKKTKIWIFVALSAYSTSMVNPIVLAAMSTEFRSNFLDILKCRSCKSRPSQSNGRVLNPSSRAGAHTYSGVSTTSTRLTRYYMSNNIEMKSILEREETKQSV